MKVDFCLPIYNEEKILKASVEKLLDYCLRADFDFFWRIVIAVNGSGDNSLPIANELKNKHPELIEVFEIKEKGRGAAIKKYWLASPADIVSYMDVDLAVDLKHLKELIGAINKDGFDMAIGSRLLPESKIERSFWRELVSQTYIFLSRLILNHRFSDLQCGFKAIKKETFLKTAPYLKSRGWFFDTELIIFTKYFGGHIKEIAVEWEENRYDQRQSKVNIFSDTLNFTKEIIVLRLRLFKIKS